MVENLMKTIELFLAHSDEKLAQLSEKNQALKEEGREEEKVMRKEG